MVLATCIQVIRLFVKDVGYRLLQQIEVVFTILNTRHRISTSRWRDDDVFVLWLGMVLSGDLDRSFNNNLLSCN